MGRCSECGREAGIMKSVCLYCEIEKAQKLDEQNEQSISVDQLPKLRRPQNKPAFDSVEQPISIVQPQQKQSSSSSMPKPKSASAPGRVLTLTKRYQDAYLVAGMTVGIGNTIKIVGYVLAALIFISTLAFANIAAQPSQPFKPEYSGGIFFAAMLFGGFYAFIVGFVFYIIGVIVAAIGQGLKAILDNTIGNSPFLPDDLKARIMSLPEV
jgi:hypothetical protein